MKIIKMIQNAESAFATLKSSQSKNGQYVQVPIDTFVKFEHYFKDLLTNVKREQCIKMLGSL